MYDRQRMRFPFTAIVGMEDAKQALLAVAVNPTIGGVLLRGDKGTGKTTIVRALAGVLPPIRVVVGCPFNCNPDNPLEMCDNCLEKYYRGEKLVVEERDMRVVDLPLSITPDRLIGTIDIEKALRDKVRALRPGVLAEANRNILYIDEVNLLDDYIADLILDVAAYGWNIIEREHVSFRHPARFILVGSMNPEEGELRPQLLDRFGLVVDVSAPMDPETRIEIVKRVEEYYLDPVSFYKRYEPEEKKLREKIVYARRILSEVYIDDDLLKTLAKTLVELKVRTCRAEITTVRTAKALAALDGRRKVSLEDLKKAMRLALPHRLLLKPFEKPSDDILDKMTRTIEDLRGEKTSGKPCHRHSGIDENTGNITERSRSSNPEVVVKPSSREPDIHNDKNRTARIHKSLFSMTGARYKYMTVINNPKGIPVSYVYPARDPIDIDIVGTMVNMAIHEHNPIYEDVKDYAAVRVRRKRLPQLLVIGLDTSGSMNLGKRISLAKSIALKLSEESYTRRTWLSLITFRGSGIDLFVPATRRYEDVYYKLINAPSGGRTPLPAALNKIIEEARKFKAKYRDAIVKVVLITDGKANKPLYRSVEEDLILLSKSIARERIELEIYDARINGIDPSKSYIDLLVEHAGARVYKF